MDIQPEDRAALVFEIYRFYDLTQAGKRLRVLELEPRWSDTGLRRSDLDVALAEMARNGLLREELTPTGPAYFLTEAGATYMRDNAMSMESRRTLFRLSKRRRDAARLRRERKEDPR